MGSCPPAPRRPACTSSRGLVVIDRTDGLRTGFGGGTYGTAIAHELGHAVGLDHVTDKRYASALMYPVMSSRTNGGFTAADRAGLRKLNVCD